MLPIPRGNMKPNKEMLAQSELFYSSQYMYLVSQAMTSNRGPKRTMITFKLQGRI